LSSFAQTWRRPRAYCDVVCEAGISPRSRRARLGAYRCVICGSLSTLHGAGSSKGGI
jgi:hypothetical protein